MTRDMFFKMIEKNIKVKLSMSNCEGIPCRECYIREHCKHTNLDNNKNYDYISVARRNEFLETELRKYKNLERW